MTDSNKWLVMTGVLLFGILFYLLSPILSPFMAAALIAYLCDPIVDVLEAKKVPRSLGVAIVFIIFMLLLVAVLVILLPLVGKQMDIVVSKAPVVLAWVDQQAIPWLLQQAGIDGHVSGIEAVKSALKSNWQNASGLVSQLLSTITSSSLELAAGVANLVLIPVVAFYLLRDWDILVARVAALLPRKIYPRATQLARECDEVIGHFLRGQLMVMLSLGIIYSLGLAIAGLDVALVVGMVAGMASVVPYLGFIVGIVMATVATLVQYQGDIVALIQVWGVFGVGQVLEGWVLTPWLVGDKIGLHPVAVIFAVLAGGQLFGFAGILLALPVAAVIVVLVRHAHHKYLGSTFYSANKTDASMNGKS